MQRRVMKWLARGAYVALVALGMVVAGPQYVAAYNPCPYPSAGTCPPLTRWPDTGEGSCYKACQDLGWPDGGRCNPGEGSCCVCFM